MDDKLKWILLAVGGYFLYDWYTSSQAAGQGVAPVPQPEPAAHPFTPAPVPVSAPPAQAPPPPSGNVSVLAGMSNDQIAAFAAQGNQDAVTLANSRGLRYTHHQWNYFRSLALGEQPDPELWAPGQSNEAVTVSQYLALRAAAGMSGITGLGWAPILPWSTAWQA